jgi:hypothetical protein
VCNNFLAVLVIMHWCVVATTGTFKTIWYQPPQIWFRPSVGSTLLDSHAAKIDEAWGCRYQQMVNITDIAFHGIYLIELLAKIYSAGPSRVPNLS